MSGYLGLSHALPRLQSEPLEDVVLLIGLLVQSLIIVEVNSLNKRLKKKKILITAATALS